MSGPGFLIVAGVIILAQVYRGRALQRMGLIRSKDPAEEAAS